MAGKGHLPPGVGHVTPAEPEVGTGQLTSAETEVWAVHVTPSEPEVLPGHVSPAEPEWGVSRDSHQTGSGGRVT